LIEVRREEEAVSNTEYSFLYLWLAIDVMFRVYYVWLKDSWLIFVLVLSGTALEKLFPPLLRWPVCPYYATIERVIIQAQSIHPSRLTFSTVVLAALGQSYCIRSDKRAKTGGLRLYSRLKMT
jgi:hypothetical protein